MKDQSDQCNIKHDQLGAQDHLESTQGYRKMAMNSQLYSVALHTKYHRSLPRCEWELTLTVTFQCRRFKHQGSTEPHVCSLWVANHPILQIGCLYVYRCHTALKSKAEKHPLEVDHLESEPYWVTDPAQACVCVYIIYKYGGFLK